MVHIHNTHNLHRRSSFCFHPNKIPLVNKEETVNVFLEFLNNNFISGQNLQSSNLPFLHHQSQPQDHLCEVWQCCKQTETKYIQENNNRSKDDDGA